MNVGLPRDSKAKTWPEVASAKTELIKDEHMPSQDLSFFYCPCCGQQTIAELGCYEICAL
jgi:hypothetical protein